MSHPSRNVTAEDAAALVPVPADAGKLPSTIPAKIQTRFSTFSLVMAKSTITQGIQQRRGLRITCSQDGSPFSSIPEEGNFFPNSHYYNTLLRGGFCWVVKCQSSRQLGKDTELPNPAAMAHNVTLARQKHRCLVSVQ
ncbi:hypothetical protein BTVI_75073 [Pitangus sulphuratus]|nr:hypothetical protein BTVI_75073 [Pitangus sulphuratus]